MGRPSGCPYPFDGVERFKGRKMKKITVNGNEYKLKFGYLAVSAGNIIGDVLNTAGELEEIDDNDNVSVYKAINKIMPLVGRIVLAGLQKYHADEFGVDYEDESDVSTKLKAVYELLDDYFDPEDGEPEESAIELFWDFANELREAGFLSGKPQTKQAEIAQIPQDHKRSTKKAAN